MLSSCRLSAKRLLTAQRSSFPVYGAANCQSWLCGSFSSNKDDDDRGAVQHRQQHHQQQQQQQQVRYFHSTRQREILPLIGAAAVFVLVRYSYKAWKRMDEEWEEYEFQLQQYEKRRAARGDISETANKSRVLATDLGSVYTKLASNNPPKPDVIVSREGDRYVFNGVVYDDDNEPQATGRAALERFFYDDDEGDNNNSAKCTVKLPWNAKDDGELVKILGDSLTPALKEALERVQHNSDGDDERPVSASWRPVVTIPVDPDPAHRIADAFYGNSSGNEILPPPLLSNDDEHVVLLPEPVASVWGAQAQGLLPHHDKAVDDKILVIDVGGSLTQCSVVGNDVVLGSNVVPWGGENIIRTCVRLLLEESSMQLSDARSLSAIQTNARSAVYEMSTKTRITCHVPYLFPDPKQHHLDTTLSRAVVEQAVQDNVAQQYKTVETMPQYLSSHMGRPTDLSSLWTSVLTQTLEQCQIIPNNIQYVLLVGGGMKAPLARTSWQAALQMLGMDQTSKVVVPDGDYSGELTVLGAATIPHAYDYSIEDGLQRRI